MPVKKKANPFRYPKPPKVSLGKIASLKQVEAAEAKIDAYNKKISEINKKKAKAEADRKKLVAGRARIEKSLAGIRSRR